MAVPGRSQAYADQTSDEVGDAIDFDLDDTFWTGSPKSFEVNVLPPGFTLDDGLTLEGVAGCKMLYIIFVRGINAEGPGAWFPLQWTVSTAATTARTLFGLPIEWPATPQHADGAGGIVIFVARPGQSASGADGILYANDVAVDGNSDRYGAAFRGFQLIGNGVGDVFLRASKPGWEITLDLNE